MFLKPCKVMVVSPGLNWCRICGCHQQYGSEFLSDIHHDGIFTYRRWLSGGTLTVTWHLETSRRTAGNITRCNKNSAVWWREVGRCSCNFKTKMMHLCFWDFAQKTSSFLSIFFQAYEVGEAMMFRHVLTCLKTYAEKGGVDFLNPFF